MSRLHEPIARAVIRGVVLADNNRIWSQSLQTPESRQSRLNREHDLRCYDDLFNMTRSDSG